MSTIIENTQDSRPELDSNALGQVVEYDGQAIYIGPQQRLSVLDDGVGLGLAGSNANVAGATSSVEGYWQS